MPDTFTPYLNLCQPEVGGSIDTWGQKTNQDWTIVDTFAENAAGQIDAAFKAAQDASADAAAVKGIADTANANAAQAKIDADQAKADAAAVKGIADAANEKATKAEQDAAAVKGIADDAKATATRAETKADAAQTTAGQAQTTANTANTTANTALNKANAAAQLTGGNSFSGLNTFNSGITVQGATATFANGCTIGPYGTGNGINMTSTAEMTTFVGSKATFVAQSDGSCRVNLSLSVGGNGFKPGGGPWEQASDKRTKKVDEVLPYQTSVEGIKQLNPIRYQYNGQFGTPDNGQWYVGLFADDLIGTQFEECVKVLPYTDPKSGDVVDIQYLDMNPLSYALVNAVKELAAKVETLSAELAALKGGA